MDMAHQIADIVPGVFGHMVAINLHEQDMRSAWTKKHGFMENDTVEWSNTYLMLIDKLRTTVHEARWHEMDEMLIRLVPFMNEEGLKGTRVVWHGSDPVVNPDRKPPDKDHETHRKKRQLHKLLNQLKQQRRKSLETFVEGLSNLHVVVRESI